MKICENCGVSLDNDHSFAVCPRCLLGEALEPPCQSDSPKGPSGVAQLPGQADFFLKYELLEKIGKGGQGDVWKVWDFIFCREVAMKRLAGDSSRASPAIHRFLTEAQITSQLDHPGILPVFDVGFDPDGQLFYTTQLLPGTTFRDVWCEVQASGSSEKSLNRALELLLRVCETLAHAHNRGVIHRDLKPANILVGAFGEVRIIDWGSAKILEARKAEFQDPFGRLHTPPVEKYPNKTVNVGSDTHHATVNFGLPVTTAYAAPELMRGNVEQLGPRSDLYSLGVMLYELLAGRLPYSDGTGQLPELPQLKDLILASPPPRLRSFKPIISRDLAAICERAMAHEVGNRYASASELAEDIRAFLEIRPVRARQPGPVQVFQKWAARNYSYVLIGSLSLVLLSILLSLAHGLRMQRDSARQMQAVRNAEWAARNGHWQEAIQHWDEAKADGYADTIYLGLQKAEAFTVLNKFDQSGALLSRLAARSDLGGQRAVVLLRLGEHELSDRKRSTDGIQLVQQALNLGLTNGDLLFAQGLLADSTPAALDLFHSALKYDPYYYEAHAQSLALEFLLGHHQELANHLTVFKILYPDDSSPTLISAIEAAIHNDSNGVQVALQQLRPQLTSNSWAEANEICSMFATSAKFYDVDTWLQQRTPTRTPLSKLRNDPFAAGAMLMPGEFIQATNPITDLRLPRLPCIRQGELAGDNGLHRLLLPYFGDPMIAVQEIEHGWQHHPEATIPVLAGMLLENQQPHSGPPLPGITEIQANLYQMGADSPSLMPQIGHLGRYLAARTDFELATLRETNSSSATTNCLANIRQALSGAEISPAECQAYFPFALGLGDYELALQLVGHLEKQRPADLSTRRDRIQVELAMGAFGPALEKINQLLIDLPNDPWALIQRQTACSRLGTLLDSHPMPFPLGH